MKHVLRTVCIDMIETIQERGNIHEEQEEVGLQVKKKSHVVPQNIHTDTTTIKNEHFGDEDKSMLSHLCPLFLS